MNILIGFNVAAGTLVVGLVIALGPRRFWQTLRSTLALWRAALLS